MPSVCLGTKHTPLARSLNVFDTEGEKAIRRSTSTASLLLNLLDITDRGRGIRLDGRTVEDVQAFDEKLGHAIDELDSWNVALLPHKGM